MIIEKVSTTEILTESQIHGLFSEAFAKCGLSDKRVLFIIPDHSRTAPIAALFRIIYPLLAERIKRLDFLIACGTHPPMSEEAIESHVGITHTQRQTIYSKARFFNHEWNNPDQLTIIGKINKDEITEVSNGFMHEQIDITINKRIFDYDILIIMGPTYPHEVVGFSGGNKYFFPGIAGREIIDMTHWLGALITNPVINGIKDTPIRKLVDKAASMIPVERLCIGLVVKDNDLAGLFIGTPEEAFSKAADLSAQLHIVYKDHSYHRVLSCAPDMYHDIWTAGKCMYKLEPVVSDEGELIIYAPHIKDVSITHRPVIEKIGYHTRDYFVKQMNQFNAIPKIVMAHSTHVKGIGTYANGVERPRIHVRLATQISEKMCKQIHLGYCHPETIRMKDWQNREDEGILFVPKAGETLYRLKEDPFHKSNE
ncbi:lactate racemase domain-containing protein [bacterium]|nr:lactate racemase domain-containing protein [bacterium]